MGAIRHNENENENGNGNGNGNDQYQRSEYSETDSRITPTTIEIAR